MVDYSKKIRIGLIVVVVLAIAAVGVYALVVKNSAANPTTADTDSAVYEVVWNGSDFDHVAIDDFTAYMQQTKEPILIDFWAEWCNPCKLAAPTIEELAKAYQGNVRVVKINTDYAGSIAQAFGVSGIPHFSIVQNSTVKGSKTGYSEDLFNILSEKLDAVLAG